MMIEKSISHFIRRNIKQKLKKIILLLTPQIMIRCILNLTPRDSTDSITYEGVFASFENVLTKYGTQPTYSTPESRFQSIQNIINVKELFGNHSMIAPNWSSIRFNFLSSFISGLDTPNICILDIGGGYGETYLHIEHSTNKNYDYHILELDHTVEIIQSLFESESNFTSHISFNTLNVTPDIVYFGSSLQYFQEYKEVLSKVVKISPEYVVISDTPTTEAETFACAQVNMPRIVIPRWVFNRDEIINSFCHKGYDLTHISTNYYPFHNFDNYDGIYKNTFHTNLIFRKV